MACPYCKDKKCTGECKKQKSEGCKTKCGCKKKASK